MNKTVNFFYLITILVFFFYIYNYYSSNKNVKSINLNRINIDEILKNKISNLPILENDTNHVIEFNSSFSDQINKNEKRNFWDLLKNK